MTERDYKERQLNLSCEVDLYMYFENYWSIEYKLGLYAESCCDPRMYSWKGMFLERQNVHLQTIKSASECRPRSTYTSRKKETVHVYNMP